MSCPARSVTKVMSRRCGAAAGAVEPPLGVVGDLLLSGRPGAHGADLAALHLELAGVEVVEDEGVLLKTRRRRVRQIVGGDVHSALRGEHSAGGGIDASVHPTVGIGAVLGED